MKEKWERLDMLLIIISASYNAGKLVKNSSSDLKENKSLECRSISLTNKSAYTTLLGKSIINGI